MKHDEEIQWHMSKIMAAARLVVPTSDQCPLAQALQDYDNYLEYLRVSEVSYET